MAEQLLMDEAGAARLRMIIEAGAELTGADLLNFALEHAVTEAGGLGGMVHVRGPGGRGLLLMASSGLVRTVAQDWEEIEEHSETAPARAVSGGASVWMPAADDDRARAAEVSAAPGTQGDSTQGESPDGTYESAPGDTVGNHPHGSAPWSPTSALPDGSGLLAVPLLTPGGTAGALSVLTVGKGQPTPWQRGAVEVLAAWAALRLRDQWTGSERTEAGRLREKPPASRLPKEPSATLLRQSLEALKMGSWEWDLATGEQVWDESTLAILGMEGSPQNRLSRRGPNWSTPTTCPGCSSRSSRRSATAGCPLWSTGSAARTGPRAGSARGAGSCRGRTVSPPAWSARCGTPLRAGSPGTR